MPPQANRRQNSSRAHALPGYIIDKQAVTISAYVSVIQNLRGADQVREAKALQMKSKGTVVPLTLRQELNNITGAEAETPPAEAADTASHA